MRQTLTVLALCSLLAGCGFHLRGHGPQPGSGWETVAVREAAARSVTGRGGNSWYAEGRDGIHRELVRALTAAGFTVSDDAALTIELLDATVKRRTASIDAQATTAAEYQIDYEVRFHVIGNDGAVVIPESSARADGSYRFNESAVLGSAEQEIVLYEDLRREIARRIVDQLRRKAARKAATDAGHADTP